MSDRSYAEEASRWRDLAAELEDRAQWPFLLGIANIFDELARGDDQGAGVIDPLGESLTLENLPAASRTRWTPRRKAEVVTAVRGGLLPIDDACERNGISLEEFSSWQDTFDRCGMPGLRVTRTQQYRNEHVDH